MKKLVASVDYGSLGLEFCFALAVYKLFWLSALRRALGLNIILEDSHIYHLDELHKITYTYEPRVESYVADCVKNVA